MMTYQWRVEFPAVLLLLLVVALVHHQVDGFLPSPTFAFCAVNRKTRPSANHVALHQLSSTATADVDQGKQQLILHEQPTASATLEDDDLLPRQHPQYQPSVLRGPISRHASEWQKALLPWQPWQKPGAVVDVSVQWKPSQEDPHHVAQRFLEQTTERAPIHVGSGSPLLVDDLAVSLRQFADFCGQHCRYCDGSPTLLKARLVATRGAPGTKCPQWHVDHVPVRWIQALVGPGCQWIEDVNNDESSSGIQWDRINALNEIDNDDDGDDELVLDGDPNDRNRLLIDAQRAVVRQAEPGEAVLLLGSEWPTPANGIVAGEVAMRRLRVRPAVHKSPEIKSPWQPRVLLTMDIAVEEEFA